MKTPEQTFKQMQRAGITRASILYALNQVYFEQAELE